MVGGVRFTTSLFHRDETYLLPLKAAVRKSSLIMRELGGEITWITSYITDDKVYCVYVAPSEEVILALCEKTFARAVLRVEADGERRYVVDVRGRNALGDHVTGKVTVARAEAGAAHAAPQSAVMVDQNAMAMK